MVQRLSLGEGDQATQPSPEGPERMWDAEGKAGAAETCHLTGAEAEQIGRRVPGTPTAGGHLGPREGNSDRNQEQLDSRGPGRLGGLGSPPRVLCRQSLKSEALPGGSSQGGAWAP